MASLTRHQTDKVGVFYILGKPRAKNKGNAETSSEKPDKIYYIMYRLDGKKVEEKVGRESERMTPAKAAKIREQRVNGVSLPNTERRRLRKEKAQADADRWTIVKLWDAYKENKPTLKGIVTDDNRFNNYLKQEFGKLSPEEINTQMVDALRLRLTKSGKKPGTVKNVLELLRRVINFGVKKGLCTWQDPSRLHFEMPRLNNTKTEMLTEDERKRFLKAVAEAPNRKAANLMLMAYYTGMRRNELFGLKWEHIDFENGFINIVGEEQEGAKSSRDERIPLSEPVREMLLSIERTSQYVFPGKDGVERLTDLNKQVNAIKKAANLPKDFRPLHGLRHTFASVVVSNGVPLSHVQKLLTHKDPKLTLRYAHFEDNALKQTANNIGAFLEISEGKAKQIQISLITSPEEFSICADIWLQASIVGHPFIDKEFWKDNRQAMEQQYLPASQVLMAYDEGIPVGFAATVGNTLAALFVLPTRWKNGIGRKLLEHLFAKYEKLSLTVYQKNKRAIAFYQRMGFMVEKQQICPHTKEQELLMQWKR